MLPLTYLRLRLRLCLALVAGLVALQNARPAKDAPPDRRAEHALERRLDRVCAVWHAFPFFLAAFVRLEFGLLHRLE
ncbi:hypothetical protein B0H14DRAFT_2783790 [Mycena olivaceomarginata]|nr:hypothetical protein B0H14DRAFT_2783790 [Mycena olivaceomarginata]